MCGIKILLKIILHELTVVGERLRREHFAQTDDVRVRQVLPHSHHSQALRVGQPETCKRSSASCKGSIQRQLVLVQNSHLRTHDRQLSLVSIVIAFVTV